MQTRFSTNHRISCLIQKHLAKWSLWTKALAPFLRIRVSAKPHLCSNSNCFPFAQEHSAPQVQHCTVQCSCRKSAHTLQLKYNLVTQSACEACKTTHNPLWDNFCYKLILLIYFFLICFAHEFMLFCTITFLNKDGLIQQSVNWDLHFKRWYWCVNKAPPTIRQFSLNLLL